MVKIIFLVLLGLFVSDLASAEPGKRMTQHDRRTIETNCRNEIRNLCKMDARRGKKSSKQDRKLQAQKIEKCLSDPQIKLQPRCENTISRWKEKAKKHESRYKSRKNPNFAKKKKH